MAVIGIYPFHIPRHGDGQKRDFMQKMDLTREQYLYLQHIFDFLQEKSRWPTYRELDQWFNHVYSHLDIEEIWKSLPSGLTNVMDLNQLESQATLTVPAIFLLKNTGPVLSAFFDVIKYCAATYSSPGKPEVSSKRMLLDNPFWWDKTVYLAGFLLSAEPNLCSSFTDLGQSGPWQCILAKGIRRFRSITTIEEYLEKRDPPSEVANASSVSNTPGINISAQNIRLHPDIHIKCWNLYNQEDYDNAIFNATKAVEIAVRNKAQLPDDLVGAVLLTQAFKPDAPILRYRPISNVRDTRGKTAILLRASCFSLVPGLSPRRSDPYPAISIAKRSVISRRMVP